LNAQSLREHVAWLELVIDCDGTTATRLSDLLSDAGAVSVSFSNASEEILIEHDPGGAPLWPATRVRGLFDQNADVDCLTRDLEAEGFGTPKVHRIREREWARAWEQHVRPQRYGNRLWVLPSFADASAHHGVCVRLDPGLAFGTGSHATTALCLEWLEHGPLEGMVVTDYGCGSGILAIAAVMLGARSARCVDNDAGALATARENARSNGVEDRLGFYSPQTLPRRLTDVLVANILAAPLIGLADEFAKLLRPGGRIALSGILEEQADAVAAAYSGYIAFEAAEVRDDWVRLSGTRGPAADRCD